MRKRAGASPTVYERAFPTPMLSLTFASPFSSRATLMLVYALLCDSMTIVPAEVESSSSSSNLML